MAFLRKQDCESPENLAMVVDNFPGTGQGDIYAAMVWDSNAIRRIMVNRADPGGTNWQVANVFHTVGAPTASRDNAALVVKTNHDVCLFWIETNSLIYCTLTGRGTGCTSPTNVPSFSNVVAGFNLHRSSNSAPNDFFTTKLLETGVINPVKNHIYFVYHNKATNGTTNPNIYCLQSTNGGSDWDQPLKVNSDSTTNGHWQPAITVKPDGTKVFIAWYDRRNDPASNSLIQTYGAFATLPITTNSFATNFLLSTVQFPPIFSGTNTNAWTFDPVYPPIYLADDPKYCGTFNGSYSHHVGDYDTAVSDNNFVYYTLLDGRNTCTNNGIIPDWSHKWKMQRIPLRFAKGFCHSPGNVI